MQFLPVRWNWQKRLECAVRGAHLTNVLSTGHFLIFFTIPRWLAPSALVFFAVMGRQWLHAKRAVASVKKAQATGKIVREIMVAAKMGGADPEGNARLATAIEKARKESVSREVIER